MWVLMVTGHGRLLLLLHCAFGLVSFLNLRCFNQSDVMHCTTQSSCVVCGGVCGPGCRRVWVESDVMLKVADFVAEIMRCFFLQGTGFFIEAACHCLRVHNIVGFSGSALSHSCIPVVHCGPEFGHVSHQKEAWIELQCRALGHEFLH